MASSMKLFFLIIFLSTFSLSRTQAREGKFSFNKLTRPADAAEAAPTAEKTGEPAALPPQSQNGYGLYGRGPSEQFSPTATAYFDKARRENGNNVPSNVPNTELANERYDERNYGRERNNYRDRHGNAGDEFDAEGRRQYGMSDTRFLDNGRYYYDVNAERNGNGNGNGNEWNNYARRGNNQKEYGVYDNWVGNRRGKYGDEGYGYGNSREYNNNNNNNNNNNAAMEEYQNNQAENQESQEEYLP